MLRIIKNVWYLPSRIVTMKKKIASVDRDVGYRVLGS